MWRGIRLVLRILMGKKLSVEITQSILQQQIVHVSKCAKIVHMIKMRMLHALTQLLFWGKSAEYLELVFQLDIFVKRYLFIGSVNLLARHHAQEKRSVQLSIESESLTYFQKRLWLVQAYIGLGISVCAVTLSFGFVMWNIFSVITPMKSLPIGIFGCLALKAGYYFNGAKNHLLKLKPNSSEYRHFIKTEYSTASVYWCLLVTSIAFVFWGSS